MQCWPQADATDAAALGPALLGARAMVFVQVSHLYQILFSLENSVETTSGSHC